MIRPNLNAFVSYASLPPARRRNQAQRAREQSESEYSPATDFWKSMRTAIVWERKTTRDGTAVLEAAERAISKKRPSFEVVAGQWRGITSRWAASTFQQPPSGIVRVGELDVAVRPLFSEVMPDGSVEHVMVWMNQTEPNEEAIRGAMRLITLLDPTPTVRAAFVDARRGSVSTATAEELKEDDDVLLMLTAALLRDAA